MIHLTSTTSILLATAPADFRKGLDGFIALCRHQLQHNPQQSAYFVFVNRSRTMVRVLAYDGTGFWLMTKRLSKGRFHTWPVASEAISPVQAAALSRWLRGLPMQSAGPAHEA